MRQVVLCFHGIGRPSRPLETGEAPYWVDEALFHEALERVAAAGDEVAVHFTFDDGNASDLAIAAEPLARAGHSAEIFVLTGRLDTPGSLSRDDLRRLESMGHRIGSHGAAHRDWTQVAGDEVAAEFTAPKEIIARELGHPVEAAAIPFGRYDRRVLARLRAAGFARVYSSDGGPVGGPVQEARWPIPRTSLQGRMDGADVTRILLGPEPLSRRLRRRAARFV